MNEIIFTAFVSALFSAYITTKIQRHFDNKKERERILFDVNMKLIELHGLYFWLASAELKKKNEPFEIEQKVWSLKWKIADMVRRIEIKELEDILGILFMEKLSHNDRYGELSKLLDRIGNKVNPRYQKIMSRISKQNIESMMPNI